MSHATEKDEDKVIVGRVSFHGKDSGMTKLCRAEAKIWFDLIENHAHQAPMVRFHPDLNAFYYRCDDCKNIGWARLNGDWTEIEREAGIGSREDAGCRPNTRPHDPDPEETLQAWSQHIGRVVDEAHQLDYERTEDIYRVYECRRCGVELWLAPSGEIGGALAVDKPECLPSVEDWKEMGENIEELIESFERMKGPEKSALVRMWYRVLEEMKSWVRRNMK